MTRSSNHIPLILWNSSRDRAEQDCACAEPYLGPVCLWDSSDEHVEEDCACPDHGLAPASTAAFQSVTSWRPAPQLYRAALNDGYELNLNPHGPTGVAVLNTPARQVLDTFATVQTPTQVAAALPDLPASQVYRATQQLARLGLLSPLDQAPIHCAAGAVNSPHTLTAWLHVTNACNLRCTYCYLEKSAAEMDVSTGRAAVEAVFRAAVRHQFRAVKLKYAGGEPLLNFGLVRTLHEHARRLADRTGLALSAVVLSNGVDLKDAVLDWLCANGTRLMVSLDGIGAVHDAQRVFADGRGSFAHVARSIDRALDKGIHPYLSITVTAHNVDHLAPVVRFALARDLLFNLNFYRETAGTLAQTALQAQNQRLIAGMRQAFDVIQARLPQGNVMGGLVDRTSLNTPHNYPCGAGRNYLVIDQQGQVARCQMQIQHPVSDIWAGDPLTAVREHPDGFQNIPAQEKQGCRDCPWQNWCAGGCPLLTHKARGRNDGPSPYCSVYKALLPQVLRMEGLRLLKWGTPVA